MSAEFRDRTCRGEHSRRTDGMQAICGGDLAERLFVTPGRECPTDSRNAAEGIPYSDGSAHLPHRPIPAGGFCRAEGGVGVGQE